ncbi:MAG: hypothetical protein LUI02_02290 [Clostridiales bacterium]|nr:hypothetical protein [Clostridiales bacterium]
MREKFRRFADNVRERYDRFMTGRNGADELTQRISIVALILIVASFIFSFVPILSWLLDIATIVAIVYIFFRTFSKNTAKRSEENQRFVNRRYNRAVEKNRRQKRRAQSGQYRFYKCPVCHQEVRVPKGHGKIEITCPKCRQNFVRKS